MKLEMSCTIDNYIDKIENRFLIYNYNEGFLFTDLNEQEKAEL